MPGPSTSVFEPTGSPLSTYSSTTRRRISPGAPSAFVPASGILCRILARAARTRHGAAEPPAARAVEDQRRCATAVGTDGRETEPLRRGRARPGRPSAPASASGSPLSSRRPSISRSSARVRSSSGSTSRAARSPRASAAHVRPSRGVFRQRSLAECRHGADPEAEVVAPEPVARGCAARAGRVSPDLGRRQKFAVSYQR